ncbi:hypothetical protein TVAG_304310 [Trichomonas vaginalis G3]|uniref:UDENN domain-containing protein n=1 Tax=Trichomonas vaginalis (strain ATCC PRA-98 / G3) TaxID=412133 RepID=A2FGR5_TRIV3|nr:UDENN domain family [Trichomonas vaginalis G3]EAX95901.1 hypothetical protein TVAG_304310 [Trichomonas vaginalis G3]KAI5551225.1 UDENN domain family [Trichomonas vaginalis G3]|eukprot:XP_001308831.1 hypothetical protein [Trichomonas vaginalis G3]
MGTFYNACCLLKYTRDNGPDVVMYKPDDFDFGKQKKSFITCAFPETQETDSIFAYTINKHLCFAWTFLREDQLYSIVVVTHHCFASLFINFFKSMKQSFTIDTPEEMFEYTMIFLGQWKYDPQTARLSVVYPQKNFSTLLDSNHAFHLHFDPVSLIGPKEVLEDVWNSIVTGRGVLFVGDTAEQVSAAIFAALSLIAPVKYADPILIYTRFGDQRFADIINGSKKWKVVGTTNILAEMRCKQFHTVVHLPNQNVAPAPEVREIFQRRMNKIIKRVESKLNKNLETDPYSDILETPLTYPQILEIINRIKFSSADFQLFQRSQTYIEWRRSILVRPYFRDSLLSFSPDIVIENRPDDELLKLRDALEKLLDKVQGDDHLIAVINQHISIVDKRLLSADLPTDLKIKKPKI